MGDRGCQSLFSYTGIKMEEDDVKEEEGVENILEEEEPERITQSLSQTQEPEDHITLRIRILDPETDLTNPVLLRTYPLKELRCPPGQQEADFFNLLRSSFPQLAAWTHFEFFVEKERELWQLELQPLTPKEIYERTGPRTIYIGPMDLLLENIKDEEEEEEPQWFSDNCPLMPNTTRSRKRRILFEKIKKTSDDMCFKFRVLDYLPTNSVVDNKMSSHISTY